MKQASMKQASMEGPDGGRENDPLLTIETSGPHGSANSVEALGIEGDGTPQFVLLECHSSSH